MKEAFVRNGVMTHYGRTSHWPGTIVKKNKKGPMVGLFFSKNMNRIGIQSFKTGPLWDFEKQSFGQF